MIVDRDPPWTPLPRPGLSLIACIPVEPMLPSAPSNSKEGIMSNKTAAAIMAAEAARQKRELAVAAGNAPGQGYDIQAGIWSYYEHFHDLLEKKHPDGKASG
jgi:hypothetical protein